MPTKGELTLNRNLFLCLLLAHSAGSRNKRTRPVHVAKTASNALRNCGSAVATAVRTNAGQSSLRASNVAWRTRDAHPFSSSEALWRASPARKCTSQHCAASAVGILRSACSKRVHAAMSPQPRPRSWPVAAPVCTAQPWPVAARATTAWHLLDRFCLDRCWTTKRLRGKMMAMVIVDGDGDDNGNG